MEIAYALRLGRPVATMDSWQLRSPAGLSTEQLGIRQFDDPGAAAEWALAEAGAGRNPPP